tara:strand:+ start:7822 stop:8913 length:1092 start_codon:yes stop_codon:yes gene_type:complete
MKHLFFASLFALTVAPQAFANEDGAYLDAPYPNLVRAIDDAHLAKNLKGKSDTNAVIDLMTPVRSQGSRGTCSIFSAAALIEGLMNIKGTGNSETDLSEEYLQYNVNAGSTSDGSYATKNFSAIRTNGMADESVLPYIGDNWVSFQDATAQKRCGYLTSTAKDSCLIVHHDPAQRYRTDAELLDETKQWYDPEFVAARNDGLQFKFDNLSSSTYSTIYNTSQVKQMLDRGIPVILEQTFYYGAWNHRTADSLNISRNLDHWSKGIVGYPFPGSMDAQQSPTKRAGHSILLVGYDDSVVIDFPVKMTDGTTKTFKLKGVYYFKNSWGTGSFGVDAEIDGVARPGYGTMTQQYAHDYGSFYYFNL